MNEPFSIGELYFIMFIIPGFISVWSYRYATYSQKKGDFELLGLSLFWGIMIAALYGHFAADKVAAMELFQNPFAAAMALSFIGALFGFSLSIFKERSRPIVLGRWFKKAAIILSHKIRERIKG